MIATSTVHSRPRTINPTQDLILQLLAKVKHGNLDGAHVAESLRQNTDLWSAFVMSCDRIPMPEVPFHGVERDQWFCDSLYLLPAFGKEQELDQLANTWNCGTTSWTGIGEKEVTTLIGYRPQYDMLLGVYWF